MTRVLPIEQLDVLPIEQLDTQSLVGLELLGVSVSVEAGLILTFVDYAGWLGDRWEFEFAEWRRLTIVESLGVVVSCSLVRTSGPDPEYVLQCRFRDDPSSTLEVTLSDEFRRTRSAARIY